MIGAIAGDVVGSRFEFNNLKSKEFDLFHPDCHFTDDTVVTLAIANAVQLSTNNFDNLSQNAVKSMQQLCRTYFYTGYGQQFKSWILSDNPQPYNSWGNGAAMRISPCGAIAQTIEQAKDLSYKVTRVTHNHPEGIKGAEAVASAIFLAKNGKSMQEIKDYIFNNYYKNDFTLNDIRPSYKFYISCQKTVPAAFEAFFESYNFEDSVRNAVSIGGDSDTIGAITGSVAGAYYGIPHKIKEKTLQFLDTPLIQILNNFSQMTK
ncbi:MAG: ADP-ribosylglycohydrolase family protein [Proteobacteria bacterium]|nr:ADP-ribosylglycohydrolase family protein [Candidatus Enterousia scatequi]